jgi:hypothetical protein
MASILERNDNGAEESEGRKTRKIMPLRKTGMISTILHAQTAMRNTRIVMRRSGRSQSGRIDYMHIERLESLLVI